MKKTAVLLIIIAIISKLIGLVRDIVLSYFYGASTVSDAYLISLTISSVVFGFVVAGISTAYIPLFRRIENEKGIEECNRFTNNLVTIVLILSSVIIGFGMLFTEQLVMVFASGFEDETIKLTVLFTRIGLLGVYFTGLVYLYTGFLQVYNNQLVPALTGFPLNIIVILAIYLSTITDIIVLAVGTLIATVSQFLIMIPSLKKRKYNYKVTLDLKDKYIRNMLIIAMPVIIGLSINQINVIIDRTLASNIVEGGISALNYASRISGFVHGIFVFSISNVMFPLISKYAVEKDMLNLKNTVSESLTSVNLLVTPATVGILFFSQPIVSFLFGRGEFDNTAVMLTSSTLFFYSLGMIGFGIRDVISRAFYSLQDTKTPMINASISVVINIILNFLLSRYLGIGGLALATSISATVCSILLMISLRKNIGPYGIKTITISFVKILGASLVMGFVAKFVFNILIHVTHFSIALLVGIIVGFLIYSLCIYFLKIQELDMLINSFKRKLKSS